MTQFDASTVAAVTQHMNGDHPEDNLLIARAFGRPATTASTMVGLDSAGGVWRVSDADGEHELRVDWPGGSISERPEVRREIVALYRAACVRLGVKPREEHEAASAGASTGDTGAAGAGHPHGHGGSDGQGHHGAGHGHGGHGHHGANGGHGGHGGGHHGHHGAPKNESAFAKALREATWAEHSSSEGATFMDDIMQNRSTLAEYKALVAQHYFMYVALERAAQQLTQDEHYAVFHPAALERLATLEEDLAYLFGANWRAEISPVPATEAYVARINELAAEQWLPGIVAHHYTRYLGDLSGGQMIARSMAKQHGFEHDGIAFYDFTELGDIGEFKKHYRQALDTLGNSLDEAERARMIEEVLTAYRFNTQTFIDLERARLAAV